MPYKSEKARIAGTSFDRRRKLDDGDRAQILILRQQDGMSYNKLARMFGVSKRLIQFVCDPEKEARCKEQYRVRRKDGRYYDRETHNAAIRNLRRYKEDLIKSGRYVEDLGR